MSDSSANRVLAKREFKGFSGIDLSAPASDKQRATKIVNFRVLPDGSLKKRNGYRLFTELPMDIRAILTGYFNGIFMGYALAGDSLYKLDFENEAYTHIGYVHTAEGKASIFYYMGHFYVADGEELYDITDDKIKAAVGYAPLLGKDWKVVYGGEINEPLNLLTPQARISYLIGDEPLIFLPTRYLVSSIQAVYLNGKLLDSSKYSLSEGGDNIIVGNIGAGDRVLAYVTFESSVIDKSRIIKNTEAIVFGGINNSRVFMWSGEDDRTMFASGYVSNGSVRESEKIYEGNGALYFPENYDFSVGDGRYAITAVNRHYNRLLIFTDGDTWMADSDACGIEDFPAMRINSENGCSALGGTAKCGNDPISVGRGKILRWTSNTDELEDCNSYSISEPIEPLLPNEFFKKAIVHEDKHNGEILFAILGDASGKVFVYGMDNRQWYSYEGIYAEKFFDGPDSIGFINKNKLYIFDERLDEDIPSSTENIPIDASYSFSSEDFGIEEYKKRIMTITVEADLGGGELSLHTESDNGIKGVRCISGDSTEHLRVYKKRMNTDRFKKVKLTLRSCASVPQRIYNVTLTAKP